jgi:hypothetical protein
MQHTHVQSVVGVVSVVIVNGPDVPILWVVHVLPIVECVWVLLDVVVCVVGEEESVPR